MADGAAAMALPHRPLKEAMPPLARQLPRLSPAHRLLPHHPPAQRRDKVEEIVAVAMQAAPTKARRI